MNFNPLEFTNTVNHNQYYPPLLEHPSSSYSLDSSLISNEESLDENNVADISTSFFSTSNFLKKLASGTLFTGRSSIYSSPMQQKQSQQQNSQQQQQNNLTDTIKKSFIFGSASNTILNTNNSIILPLTSTTTTTGSNNIILPQDYLTNSVILNASTFSEEAYQRQIEYDKFMNEIWVGIVLTLIIISMIFCICSCFLYHQFRLWKANYRNSVRQQHNQDIESVKFNLEDDDPVPQYTLVSGLPTYEAALDMLKKLPNLQQQLSIEQQQQQQHEKLNNNNCKYQATTRIYPSVFSIFTKNEKSIGTTTIESSSENINNNNNNSNNNNNNITPSELITINESLRKSLLNIEKLPSTSSSLEVELKSLVNNLTTNSCSTSNSETITTNTNTIRTTSSSSSSTCTDENYGNFQLLSYNVMHRNNTSDNLTILLKSSPKSSQVFENIEKINDMMIDSFESSSLSSFSDDDEDDNNCEKLENHEETPLKKHHLHP